MAVLSCFSQTPTKTLKFSLPKAISSSSTRQLTFISNPLSSSTPVFRSNSVSRLGGFNRLSCKSISTISTNPKNYEFSDGSSEVELRLQLDERSARSSKDILVNTDENSLTVRVKCSGSLTTLVKTDHLYDKIKPAETIWYLDDNQLVVNLKKQEPDLKWPDIVESWESLAKGAAQYFKGASIYLVGDSTEINEKVARELAVGLGYTPLNTRELLESFAKQTIDSWVTAEGSNSIADAESAMLESLSSHVRAVVATLGGHFGAAERTDKWRHLYGGFTVWLSQSEALDEISGKEEARRQFRDGASAYSKADVVVKLGGWDGSHAKTVAQASLSALKQLIMSDKKLPGKKSLYIRMGCRGDWPNIKPPGWDPSSTGAESPR